MKNTILDTSGQHVAVAVLMFEYWVWDCNLTARWYDRKAVLYMVRDKFLNTCELAIFGSNLQQMNDHSYEYTNGANSLEVHKSSGRADDP